MERKDPQMEHALFNQFPIIARLVHFRGLEVTAAIVAPILLARTCHGVANRREAGL